MTKQRRERESHWMEMFAIIGAVGLLTQPFFQRQNAEESAAIAAPIRLVRREKVVTPRQAARIEKAQPKHAKSAPIVALQNSRRNL